MLRAFHKLPGLFAAIALVVLALSGAALSVIPAYEVALTPAASATITVADLAAKVAQNFATVEQISRAPSGTVTAYYFDADTPKAVVIDPATGKAVADYTQSKITQWLTDFHRALLLDDTGRIAAAILALVMLAISLSGVALITRRVGGWRKWFAKLRGPLAGRIHVEISRWAVPGLLLSSITALLMFAFTFSMLPEDAASPRIPNTVSESQNFPIAQIPTLIDTPLTNLRDLTFPVVGDPTDVFTLQTDLGQGYIDQGTGALLVFQNDGPWQRFYETIYMLHTGQGAWWLGLLLGLAGLGVPVLAITGTLQWYRSYRSQPRLRQNASAALAETVILVASEGGTTWGFAACLHRALTDAGQPTHIAAFNRFAPEHYANAKRIILMAATYGEGAAPAQSAGFLTRLAASPLKIPTAVLGFGDRQFPAYCGYANDIVDSLHAQSTPELIALDTVDRQSPQDFARWGHALGQAMGLNLTLAHHPAAPRSHALTLISRRDYGVEMQLPSAILRFATPKSSLLSRLLGRAFPSYRPGDLLGIVPEGEILPRFYSLASGNQDGFVEICVRKHPGGICSGQLMDLQAGDQIHAFIRENPDFRPNALQSPVILIGAGTGIGPLVGFARHNKTRPMHLYFGARHPNSDLLYAEEMQAWLTDGRLTAVTAAFSRVKAKAYVQDLLHRDAAQLALMLQNGAQVLVCGGRDMAAGVKSALADVLAPHGLTPAMLKAEGRYAEDVY
jgi:sulfite reductase (NADPH) flavoprotein alpha-component